MSTKSFINNWFLVWCSLSCWPVHRCAFHSFKMNSANVRFFLSKISSFYASMCVYALHAIPLQRDLINLYMITSFVLFVFWLTLDFILWLLIAYNRISHRNKVHLTLTKGVESWRGPIFFVQTISDSFDTKNGYINSWDADVSSFFRNSFSFFFFSIDSWIAFRMKESFDSAVFTYNEQQTKS